MGEAHDGRGTGAGGVGVNSFLVPRKRVGPTRAKNLNRPHAEELTLPEGRGGVSKHVAAPILREGPRKSVHPPQDEDGVALAGYKLSHLAREPRPLGECARDVGMRGGDRFVFGHGVGVSACDLGDRCRLD